MESTQRSPGLRTRTRGARLGRTSNLFGAGMNLGPLRPPPAAARAGQIRRSFFHNIAPLVYLAFSDLFGRGRCPHRPASGHRPPYNTHNIRSSYAVGRDDPARLVITTTPPHPLVLASSACPRAVSLAPAGQFTFSFISTETAETHSLRCSSSPQRDPASAVINGRGGARERSEGCPRLGVPNRADFATTRWAGWV